MRLQALMASLVAIAIFSSAHAAEVAATNDQLEEMNRAMERFAQSYGTLTLDAGRCETALKVNDPDWKPVCDRYRLGVQGHLLEARRLSEWCSAEMKALRARDTAFSRSEYDALSYCSSTREMDGLERFRAVTALL